MIQQHHAYNGSLLNFIKQIGFDVNTRTQAFFDWIQLRREENVWPYGRMTDGLASFKAFVTDDISHNQNYRECINFGSQDYLGLAADKRIHDAAKNIIDKHGIHSAGSPALTGRTSIGYELECLIADKLHKETALLFSTGWAAGFGTLAGLIRENDYIIIDELSHNCIQEGAVHRTKKVKRFKHNNIQHLEEIIINTRQEQNDSCIFVVLESLYSMDSDPPNIQQIIKTCQRYKTISILDIAHDFGSMAENGLGALSQLAEQDYPDIIFGSFSKTFATNGGFVACSQKVKDYLSYYSPPHIFSNAITPIQIAIATACFTIIFSEEGSQLRQKLLQNSILIRQKLMQVGFIVQGLPSPIVPVYVGTEKLARLTAREMENRNLIANMVEFPAVPRGKARFRLQIMAVHTPEQITYAVNIMQTLLANALSLAPEESIFSPLAT